MIVLPLFWDQVDNAQRVDETGFGERLPAYAFREEELLQAIDRLLADRHGVAWFDYADHVSGFIPRIRGPR